MWEMLRVSFLVGLAAVVVGTPAYDPPAPQNDPPVPVPILARIHTVSIHVKDFPTFNRAFHFLSDDLRLPKKWGQEWTPEAKAKRM